MTRRSGGHEGSVRLAPLGRWCAAALSAGLLASIGSARADVRSDVAAVARAWSRQARVAILPPRIMTHGDLLPISLPPDMADPKGKGCTTVAVIGAMSTGFVLRFLPPEGPPRWRHGESPETSVAGAAQLVRCGRRRAMLSRLAIEMRSPRGVLQTVVAEAKRPLSSVRRLLPHREPGVVASSVTPGPRPAAAPIDERVRALEERYARLGAAEVERRLVAAAQEGAARISIDLEAGCHRLEVLGIAPDAGQRIGLDIDAELRWADGAELADIDRSDSPDAALTICTGQRRNAVLTFAGGIPDVPVLVVHARWELPAGLPERWGPEPRARIAEALWRTSTRIGGSSLVYESLGVAGTTVLPIEVEPGACYLVAATPLRGAVRLITLTVSGDSLRAQSHGDDEDSAIVAAFCNERATHAAIDVQAHGQSVTWLLAVWQTGRVRLGEGAR